MLCLRANGWETLWRSRMPSRRRLLCEYTLRRWRPRRWQPRSTQDRASRRPAERTSRIGCHLSGLDERTAEACDSALQQFASFVYQSAVFSHSGKLILSVKLKAWVSRGGHSQVRNATGLDHSRRLLCRV